MLESNKNTKWFYSNLVIEAKKYKTKTEFQKNSSGAYKAAVKNKILNEICSHMDLKRLTYTTEELSGISLKYKNRFEFQKKNISAYTFAYRRNLLDQVCKHMTALKKEWNFNDIHKIALKYKNRADFARLSNDAYQAAKKREMLDAVCLHMTNSRCSSFQEKELLKNIQKKYPSACQKKFSAKKYNKPFKCLEIDIYIPEIKKGIEFDGTYWHGRGFKLKKWCKTPEEYHQIKDAFFNSIGIQVLHIKEEHWDKNQEQCLKQVFQFLEA